MSRLSRLLQARVGVHPCLTAELLEEMGARETALGAAADPLILYGPLSRREKLELHLAVFFVGSGSLVMIDVTHSPHHLWFWPWVAGWAGVLLVHCALSGDKDRHVPPAGLEPTRGHPHSVRRRSPRSPQ